MKIHLKFGRKKNTKLETNGKSFKMEWFVKVSAAYSYLSDSKFKSRLPVFKHSVFSALRNGG